jgi:hypothetical protein
VNTQPINDSTPLSYKVIRYGLAFTGLLLIGSLALEFLSPRLVYEDHATIPSLTSRLPKLAGTFTAGLLFILPFHWQCKRSAYWLRLAISCVLTLTTFAIAYLGIVNFARGGRSWHILPASATIALIGLLLPVTLQWRRQMALGSTATTLSPHDDT